MKSRLIRKTVPKEVRDYILYDLQKYIYLDKSVNEYTLEKITLSFKLKEKNIDNLKENDKRED